MESVETTISEHILNQGILMGRAEGIIEGQLAALENLYRQGAFRFFKSGLVICRIIC